ncbi:MAG: hypothetical protein KDD27_17330 [Saprospiraceae bacterium]|nr:hypothetical protein [Saprospiraceae bacterium]
MKLLTLLRALRPEEHKELDKFLQSPFFKASPSHLLFFRHLCKYHPGFDLGKAELVAAYRRCFGQKEYTDSRLYNLMSALAHNVEDFMVVKETLGDKGDDAAFGRRAQLVRALGRRDAGEHFQAEAQKLVEETNAVPVKDAGEYLALQQVHHQLYYNYNTPTAPGAPSLLAADACLDRFYCLDKLRYMAQMKALERLFNVRYEFPMLEAVLEMTRVPAMEESDPLLAIYGQLVGLLFREGNESGFRELQKLYLEKYPMLPTYEQPILLRQLINYGVFLTEHQARVEPELLQLYKKAIAAGVLLFDNGRLTEISFANIVSVAAICRDFGWAEDFIAQFSPHLEDGANNPVVGLSRTALMYYQGDLDAAQDLLVAAKLFSQHPYDIRSRGLLLKIAFDRYVLYGQDYDFLTGHLKAYEKYVGNQPLSEYKIQAQLNHIRFVRKMAALKFKHVQVPPGEKEKLREKLKALSPVVSMGWMEERIGML